MVYRWPRCVETVYMSIRKNQLCIQMITYNNRTMAMRDVDFFGMWAKRVDCVGASVGKTNYDDSLPLKSGGTRYEVSKIR